MTEQQKLNDLLRSAVWSWMWGSGGDSQGLHKRIQELLAAGAQLPPKDHPYWRGSILDHLGEGAAKRYDRLAEGNIR
jgi:hypothetical protein